MTKDKIKTPDGYSSEKNDDKAANTTSAAGEEVKPVQNRETNRNIIGSLLILIGIYFFSDFYGIFDYFTFFEIKAGLQLPVLLIIIGTYLFVNRGTASKKMRKQIRLVRSLKDRKFMGVCGGLANYLGTDSSLIRMVFIVFIFITIGFGLIIYFAAAYYINNEPEGNIEEQTDNP